MPGKSLETLKAQERKNRRQLILDAARSLFAEKDFRSVTVRQIAKSAGISIGTVYNYYENLDELFLDVFLENAESIIRQLDQRADGEKVSLKNICIDYVAFLNDHMTFYQMMGHFMLGGTLSPAAAERLDHMMRALMDRIEGGIVAGGNREDTRLKAHALFSSLNGVMISYAGYPGRSPEEIRKHTLRLAGLIADFFTAEHPDSFPVAFRDRAGPSPD